MLRPPVNRAMRKLDRGFFNLQAPISAARIFDNKQISSIRSELMRSRDALQLERLGTVRSDPDPELERSNKKCLLLRPDIKHDDKSTWSSKIVEMVQAERIGIVPYDLYIDYKYWTYHDIMSSILPVEETDELPSGFTQVGHVAQLNLRDRYLPYKTLIAEVILDKNPKVTTVINKIADVGEESRFRTFPYEVLAGPDEMNVEVNEEGCVLRFDFSKVYWNSRLQPEHKRLVSMFEEGQAVCDVTSGVGPFALPAGKKHVFVWANDLNPVCFESLKANIQRNKVHHFITAFNLDGSKFIRQATATLLTTEHSAQIQLKPPQRSGPAKPAASKSPEKILKQPRFFSHYVMNLPAYGLSFLPSFVGLFSSKSLKGAKLPCPEEELKMPCLHVECFVRKVDAEIYGGDEPTILAIIKEHLNYEGFVLVDGAFDSDGKLTRELKEGEVAVWDVRDVAPNKRMFCVSFRLPREVAFREVDIDET